MDECLLDIACRSDKRKDLLLYLLEGPHNIDDIKFNLHVSSTGMLPQIKILKENGFIEQDEDNYTLSLLGRVAAVKLKSFLDLTETFDQNYDYWFSRDISAIPLELQKKFGVLRNCEIISPDLDCLFEPSKEIVNLLSSSKEAYVISSHYHQFYVSFFDKFIAEGNAFSAVISGVEIFLEKNMENFRFAVENSTFYLSDIPLPFSWLIVSENFIVFNLLNSKKEYDGLILFDKSPEAVEWGMELFEYCKSHSHRIMGDDLK